MPLDPLQANASSSYEDTRRHPLSPPQKLKGFLVQVISASFGHKPGHVPNASLQKAWAAEEKQACLERRYLSLAPADTYRTTVNATGAIFSAANAVQGLGNEQSVRCPGLLEDQRGCMKMTLEGPKTSMPCCHGFRAR